MTRDLIITLCALVIGFALGYGARRTPAPAPPEVRVDTLYVRDTIVSLRPVYERVKVVDTMTVYVPVHDTIHRTDSVFVQLPREQLEWADTLATVWVSGYRPAVDSVRHYVTERIVTVTERIPAPRWGVGIQGGVGATTDGLRPYIGIGVQYNVLSLTR